MENERQIIPGSAEDPDNPNRVLSRIREITVPSSNINKIVYIPWDRSKFVCPNHRVKMTINMSDSGMRDKGNKMSEYTCDCGIIYIRTKDQKLFNHFLNNLK